MGDAHFPSAPCEPDTSPVPRALLIGAARYRSHSYGADHPLGIPRVSLTLDLIRSYDALAPDEYCESRAASDAELEDFHTRDYVRAMRECERLGRVPAGLRHRHNLGNRENPYFSGFFTTPATAAGGSLQGADAVLAGHLAFNPAGGMHHARPDQARGFCFFNDAVLALRRLRLAGLRVLYLDIDAHHGDGVEQAMAGDPDVLTMSLHMDTTYAYPFAGGDLADHGTLGTAVNVPLPQGTGDADYRHLFAGLWPAVLAAFAPDAVVLQAGTDMLRGDPLSRLCISTRCFLDLVSQVLAHSPRHAHGTPRLLVLGGGGYHPLWLARCWTGVWALLSGRELPEDIPPAGRALLEAVKWERDDPRTLTALRQRRVEEESEDGAVRPEVRRTLETLLSRHPLFAA